MGFKMKGPSMHQGTAAHKSALKIKSIEARKKEIAAAGMESASGESSTSSPAKQKLAYGGTKTWEQAEKDSGGTLNQITRDQKAYEKKMKAKDPSWNKREDNEWKKRQNKINKHVGSKKVYDTIDDSKTKVIDGESKMKGLGANKGKTLTEERKQNEKTNISIEKDKIKKAKENKDKDARDESQKEIGEIKSGRDDKYTGTVVSRFFGKQKAKRNQRQLDRRENKRTKLEKRYKKRTAKGKSTERLEKRYAKKGGDVEELKSSPATYKKKSPAKVAPLVAMAGKALAGAVANKAVDKATEK